MINLFLFEGMENVSTSSKGMKYCKAIYLKELSEDGTPCKKQLCYPLFGAELCEKFSKLEQNCVVELEFVVKDISITGVKRYD